MHSTTRRRTSYLALGGLAATLAGALLGVQTVAGRPGPAALASVVDPSSFQPNIVVVMADDARADDLRFLPAVNKVITDRGLTYRNSFSPYPLCCPARASFLTGQYAHNHKVLNNERPYGFAAFDDSATLATSLRAAGYNTAMVGKYLNLYGKVRSKVTGRPSLHYVPAGWSDWYVGLQPPHGSHISGSAYDYFDTPFNANGKVDARHKGQYQTDVIGRFSRRLVRKYSRSDKPFFLYLSALAPHNGSPVEPDDASITWGSDDHGPPSPARPNWVKGHFDDVVRKSPGLPLGGGPSERDVSDKPRILHRPDLTRKERHGEVTLTRQRAEALFVLDRQFARLVATLKKHGEYDDTVFVFTSDNGYFLGEHRLRSGKTKAYEPSIRVPLVIAGPGIPHGVRYDPAKTPDLSATIVDLAHAEPPHVPDGRSLVESFPGDAGWSFPVVTEAHDGGRFYTRASHRSARGFEDARTQVGLRTARWKLTVYSSGEVELYDLDSDPNELQNVAADPGYAGVLAELERVWWDYKDCAGEACQAALPDDLVATPDEEAESTQRQDAGVRMRTGVGFETLLRPPSDP
jgi:N-acetylglucosamine-6-sulfatase